jgi:hypothetical protein
VGNGRYQLFASLCWHSDWQLATIPIMYDTHISFDPWPEETAVELTHRQQKLELAQLGVRALLPYLHDKIKNPKREENDVHQVLRPLYLDTGRDVPMTPADLPEIEAMFHEILSVGGPRQAEIQEVLLRLVGATAAVDSVPFLLDALHFTKRGDQFGPERRQLALWGLARIAIRHNHPEAYLALRGGLNDRRAEVRLTAVDLILNAYLDAGRKVPAKIVTALKKMAANDPDKDVRWAVQRCLREPWTDLE